MLSREKLGQTESHEAARPEPERHDLWMTLKRWAALPGRQSRTMIAIVSTVAVFSIGAIDYISGNEISWSIIYVIPIALATWHLGRGFAYALSILSVVLWITGEFATGLQVSSWVVPVWNSTIRLGFYYAIIGMLHHIRSLTNDLESRVFARTADLRKEIVERERLEHELLEAGERERRRIGYDLHDGLGQHLTGISLAVQVLRKKLQKQGLAEADEAGKAVALIEEGIALSHKLAKGLQPVEMHAGGLMQALQDFAVATSDMFKVACRFKCDAPILVSDVATADHLYRIAQEATSNAVKHGHATTIVITLEAAEEGTLLKIADNGIGIVHPEVVDRGMGLRIMRQRAKLIGAVVDIVSLPRKGTIITCLLPLAAEQKAEARRA
jgi:signal transduction histidine kinase